MALNWGDVALNLTAGAIEKDEVYRKEALENRFKELADNKELYRSLAVTRYSKDLDRYYEESKKYSDLQNVYKQIQAANGGRGMNKRDAAMMIIGSSPERAFAFKNAKDEVGQEAIIKSVMAGFEDQFRDETIMAAPGMPTETKKVSDGYKFSHSGMEYQAPKMEDYFKDPDFWTKLSKEIESGTKGPLQKKVEQLFGLSKGRAESLEESIQAKMGSLDAIKGTTIQKDIAPEDYFSKNTDKDIAGMITNPDNSAFANDSKALSVLNTKYQTYAGEAQTGNKGSILSGMNVFGPDVKNTIAHMVEGKWVIKDEGQVFFNQARQIYNQVVNELYFDIVKVSDNPYSGRDDLFTDEEIQNRYLNEMRNRRVMIDNKNLFAGLGLDEGKIKGSFILPTSVLPLGFSLSDEHKAGLEKHLNTIFKDSDETLFELYPKIVEESNAYLNVQEKTAEEAPLGPKVATENDILNLWKDNRNKTLEQIIKKLEEEGFTISDELREKEITLPAEGNKIPFIPNSKDIIEDENIFVPDETLSKNKIPFLK